MPTNPTYIFVRTIELCGCAPKTYNLPVSSAHLLFYINNLIRPNKRKSTNIPQNKNVKKINVKLVAKHKGLPKALVQRSEQLIRAGLSKQKLRDILSIK